MEIEVETRREFDSAKKENVVSTLNEVEGIMMEVCQGKAKYTNGLRTRLTGD